jgi:formiminotetrahydrofolate cyclodeaminase
MYRERTIAQFLDELASQQPTPGGGSTAALIGALAAGLVSMVCSLTLANERHRDVWPRLRPIHSKSEELREQLTRLIDDDVAAYAQVAAAMKMPRGTDEEREARTQAMQAALKAACQPPLAIMRACTEVLSLCVPTAKTGSKHAISDVSVAVYAAQAGLRGAEANVGVNLALLKDQEYARSIRSQADAHIGRGGEFVSDAMVAIRERA